MLAQRGEILYTFVFGSSFVKIGKEFISTTSGLQPPSTLLTSLLALRYADALVQTLLYAETPRQKT